VNASCQRALAFDLVNVRRLELILRADLETVPAPAAGDPDVRVFPLRPRFARANSSFSHAPAPAVAPASASQSQSQSQLALAIPTPISHHED
jgi:hypothetical protein